jgi:hypothetical protein
VLPLVDSQKSATLESVAIVAATAHFHFAVSGLLVDVGLLGTSFTQQSDGYSVTLTFPRSEDSFGRNLQAQGLYTLGGGMQDAETGEWTKRSVGVVRVSVDCDLPMSSDDFDPTHRALETAANAARMALGRYLELARTDFGQHQLGLSAGQPKIIWITEVVDRCTGQALHVGYADPLRSVGVRDALSVQDDAAIRDRLDRGVGSSLPRTLLADAKYLAWITSPSQRREALLLAAIACEVAIKMALRRECFQESRALLDYALDNPRDVTQQAAGLFNNAAKAITGRSLKDEDNECWKGLVKLFQDRNNVAHRGEDVDPEALRNALLIATKSVNWAETLQHAS